MTKPPAHRLEGSKEIDKYGYTPALEIEKAALQPGR
jgi:hypothetical protein